VRGQRHAPAALYPRKDPVCIVQEAGWAPRAGLDTCGKSRPPTGIRSPERPARSQSLYRLSYPAHQKNKRERYKWEIIRDNDGERQKHGGEEDTVNSEHEGKSSTEVHLDKSIFVAILQEFDCEFSFKVSANGTTETLYR